MVAGDAGRLARRRDVVRLEHSLRCPQRILDAAGSGGEADRPGGRGGEPPGAAPTSARRRRAWPPTSSGSSPARASSPRRSRARALGAPRGTGRRRRARGARRALPAGRRGGVLPARRGPRRSRLAAPARRSRATPAPSCARSRGRRSSCAPSTSRAARRSSRRRKLDMVSALVAATESPQIPPEARERILVFLKLYRSASRGARHHAARPVRPPPDRAPRPAPPAALRRAGRRRRAPRSTSRGFGELAAALRAPLARRPRRGSSPASSPRWPRPGCARRRRWRSRAAAPCR